MKLRIKLLLLLLLFFTGSCKVEQEAKHLFVLSGQSNMERLQLQESFIPTIEGEFGKEKVIIVKDAHGGQPIRRWYKNWNSSEGDELISTLDLYDTLMHKVNNAIGNNHILTVTFIWMQGESDAKAKLGDSYEKSLIGLYKQLSKDLGRKDIYFIIGRLNDFDMQNKKFPHWTMIRDIQVKVGDSNPQFEWINTDDLNDGLNTDGVAIKNDLHLSQEGYIILGKRFAYSALALIKNKK